MNNRRDAIPSSHFPFGDLLHPHHSSPLYKSSISVKMISLMLAKKVKVSQPTQRCNCCTRFYKLPAARGNHTCLLVKQRFKIDCQIKVERCNCLNLRPQFELNHWVSFLGCHFNFYIGWVSKRETQTPLC